VTHVTFGDRSQAPAAPAAGGATTTLLIGTKPVLKGLFDTQEVSSTMLGGLLSEVTFDPETVTAMIESGKEGALSSTFVKSNQLHLAFLPETVSRNNHPWSVHTVTDLVAKAALPGHSRIVFCGDDVEKHTGALVSAVAKAFPLYTQKTSTTNNNNKDRSIHVGFASASGGILAIPDASNLGAVYAGVQLAARLMDMPPCELTTTAYADECRRIAKELNNNVSFEEIMGEELNTRGYGGLYGVGKAATCPPRLVILEYTPTTEYSETVALVGKGIVYDTGGLSLKSKDGMPGMKSDMGGSAGLLGAFGAAVQLKLPKKIVLILCLAENAIGPLAFRNDDILTMYSGKTVEINNTDAEGRLVLADGVAHATKHIDKLDLVVDMATLTGAQLIATGKKHAGILANTAALEQRAVAAGLASGDLVFPLLYAPELLQKEFDSKVADMKNSVKDRSNAQTSCAGHFIESHLDENYKGGWLHVDMAGPSLKDERGVGYGVGLVLALLEAPVF
jgi:probable aminopeptidase NPEPL1